MDYTQINSIVPCGTIYYYGYNLHDDDYFKLTKDEFQELCSSFIERELDYEIRIIVEDGKTKIVLI